MIDKNQVQSAMLMNGIAFVIAKISIALFSFLLFLSPPGIVFIFIRYNCLFDGKSNPPFFSGGD